MLLKKPPIFQFEGKKVNEKVVEIFLYLTVYFNGIS
jgi:hypothetical protein